MVSTLITNSRGRPSSGGWNKKSAFWFIVAINTFAWCMHLSLPEFIIPDTTTMARALKNPSKPNSIAGPSLDTPPVEAGPPAVIDNNPMAARQMVALSDDPTRHPNLWIHVLIWREGMVAWRGMLRDVLALAKSLNAVLVEPCVSHGRMTSCGLDYTCVKDGYITKCSDSDSAPVALHEMYDTDFLRKDYWPHIASYDEFVRTTGYNRDTNYTSDQQFGHTMFVGCLQQWGPGGQEGLPCTLEMKGRSVASTYQKKDQPSIEDAFRAAAQAPATPIVLDINEMTRYGLSEWVPSQPGMKAMEPFDLKKLRFPSSARQQVKSMLSKFNITDNNYAVIQWRPETFEIDYFKCADAIIGMRGLISQRTGIPMENFVLISPLSLHKSLQWGGVRDWAEKQPHSSYPSLQRLYDAGFHKLEQTFDDNVIDGSLLSVWDFTLAQEAKYFTNCAQSSESRTSAFCDICNHRGMSQDYTLEVRRELKGEDGTFGEWPL